MENSTGMTKSKVTPKDFFLWAAVVIALYTSVVSFITLLFEYVNHAFPDQLASYGDPYSGAIRFSMAALIVLVPATLILMRVIRASLVAEPGKADIWVRRWALMLTLFIAGATAAIDLITLVNTFLGGEVSNRFLIKVAIVLLVAAWVFMHFLADLKGYWIQNPRQAKMVGIAAAILVLSTIASGFFIIGTPGSVRLIRYDEQKVNDLQSIQSQVVNFYQLKQKLPATLNDLNDPLSGYSVPEDQQGQVYEYIPGEKNSFSLCASFNKVSQDMAGKGSYPARDISYPMGTGMNDTWQHEAGRTCFVRTIDPQRFPPITPGTFKQTL